MALPCCGSIRSNARRQVQHLCVLSRVAGDDSLENTGIQRCSVQCLFSDLGMDGDPCFDPAEENSLSPECRASITDLLGRIKKRLSPRTWTALYSNFADGQTLREIGASLGLSKDGVLQLLLACIRRAKGERSPKGEPAHHYNKEAIGYKPKA